VRGRDLSETRRLERALVFLRWLVVAFGTLQAALAFGEGTEAPGYEKWLVSGLVTTLFAGNVLVSVMVPRAEDLRRLQRVGLGAFALDIAVVTGLVWASTEPGNSLWALAYIPPLEGAIRFGLIGALVPVGVSIASELARETVLSRVSTNHPLQLSIVGTRLGVEIIVAVVAGTLARSVSREAEKARERARQAERTARLARMAADRETKAWRELSAFHTAVLAGLSEDSDDGIQYMAEAVGRELRCDAFAVLLFEPHPGNDWMLVAEGVHGEPGYARGDRFSPTTRLGEAAQSERPIIHTHPPEGIVPLRIGEEAIGVLHERTSSIDAMDREHLLLLGRLADQVALVAHAARLRARRHETLGRLQELEEMKSDFVAITSHELRTPLAAIRGFVNTLRRRMDDLSLGEVQEFLAIVDTQTDRLIRLVEDLLVVSRIEAQRLTLRSEDVEIDRVLDQVMGGLTDRGRVEIYTDPRLPAGIITDSRWLSQLLTNLIQNALKFSPADTRVTLNIQPDGTESVTFSISDEGPGIPLAERARIFERFHQADAASTRRSEGAGLGLYIAKQIVDAMGGRIDLVSEEGRGSTFTVRIPVRPRLRAHARGSREAPED
jgi:signal transduction histidine kinase